MGVVAGRVESGRVERGLAAPGSVRRWLRSTGAALAPVLNWRLPILAAYDSAGTATAQLAASSADKTWPVINTATGATRTFAVKVDTVGPAGGFLAFSTFMSAGHNTSWSVAFAESSDSTTGADGTWTEIPWTGIFPPGSAMNFRTQPIPLAPGPARWVRGAVTNNTGANIAAWVGAFGWPESGLADAWVVVGASLEADGHRSQDMVLSWRAAHPSRDPVIFNYAHAGVDSAAVETRVTESLSLFPKASYWIFDTGGNTVTSNRPYPGAAATMYGQVQRPVQAIKAAGKVASLCRLTYRNYTASPAVNGLTNQENGSKPYNEGIIDPIVRDELPDHYDSDLGIGRVDQYSVVLVNRDTLTADAPGIHPNGTGYAAMRKAWAESFGAWVYTGSWPASQVEQYIVAAETTPTEGGRTSAQEALDALPSSAKKTALQGRIDAIQIVVAQKIAQINVGSDTATIVGWQNWHMVGTGSVSSLALNDPSGIAIGWTIARGASVPETSLAIGGREIVTSDGLFPAEVNRSFARFNTTATTITLTLSGLNNAKTYKLAFVSSRITAATNYRTRFTVNGDTAGAIVLDPAAAVPPVASFPAISPSSGNITIVVDRNGTADTNAFGYLNAIRIEEN